MFKRLLLTAIFALGLSVAQAAGKCPQPTVFDGLLKSNVDKDGYVDYDGFRVNKGGDLYEYISLMETADLSTCGEMERLAFWINAYNAHMIRLVLARPNLKQVSEDFKVFAEPFKVARLRLSLNDIEHRIIRSDPQKGGGVENISVKNPDQRIHFAIVNGAIDSPKLNNRAYAGPTLDAVLQANAIAFANNPKYLRIENGKLVMSAIFKWYEADFARVGGVAAYLSSLTDSKLRPDADAIDAKLATDFPNNVDFKFDWTLNSIKNKK